MLHPKHRADPGVIGEDGSTEGDRRHSAYMHIATHRKPVPYREVLRAARRERQKRLRPVVLADATTDEWLLR